MASARAREFAIDLGKLHENLKLHIRQAQQQQKQQPTTTTTVVVDVSPWAYKR